MAATALAIGGLQHARLRLSRLPARAPALVERAVALLENVVRTSIVLAMYALFEAATRPEYASLTAFFRDPSHTFVAIVIPLLGLLLGFADVSASASLVLLRTTAGELRRYSEWLLGPALLSRAVADPAALTLTRRERAVVFMDIRGFTRWSEGELPETVVAMLDAYYEAAEGVWSATEAIKVKLTAASWWKASSARAT